MHEHRFQADSVERALDLLRDRWVFLILREAFFDVRRFGQLQRNLGIARNVLSDRLRALVAAGVLERHGYRSNPVWYEYRLTEMGRALYPAIVMLMRWGDEFLAGPEGPPLILRHDLCGHDTAAITVCSHCRQQLRPADVTPEAGPGAASAQVEPPAQPA